MQPVKHKKIRFELFMLQSKSDYSYNVLSFRLIEAYFKFSVTFEIKSQFAFFVKLRIDALVFDENIKIIFPAYIMDKF